jgi:hypothetical protein
MAVAGNEMSRAMAAAFDVSAAALSTGFTGASQNVGSHNGALSNANVLLAINNINVNAKGLADPSKLCFVLHPAGIHDLRTEATAGSSAALSPVFGRQGLIDIWGKGVNSAVSAAYKGDLYGVPVLQSTSFVAHTSSEDYTGILLVRGEAILAAIKWMPRIEIQRETNNGRMGTRMLGSFCYGVGEKRDVCGVAILHGI